MATVTVDVDIDLDEFETFELLEEVESRYLSGRTRANDKKEIKEFAEEILDIKTPQSGTLLNTLKLELVMNNIDKFTLDELEEFFKSK